MKAAALVSLVAASGLLFAQALPPTDYLWLKAFIRAAYPELCGNGTVLSAVFQGGVDAQNEPPLVRITVRGRVQGGAKAEEQGAVVLSAVFSTEDHVSFDFPEGSSGRALDSITQRAAAHPEWTDADLVAALHQAKADYPFDSTAAFLRHADIDRFAPVLGTIRKTETDFVWRRPEAPQLVVIRWRVKLETLAADGRAWNYVLAFEPMHGRLLSLFRAPAGQTPE